MTLLIWLSFLALVTALVVIDLGILHRTPTTLDAHQALRRWLVWLALGLGFTAYIYFLYETNWLGWGLTSILDLNGREAAVLYFTGYLIELSLSVDNVFVFALIFNFMRVPAELQYRVLFWGVLGAIILRGVMIGVGINLMSHFHWMTYVFGTILLLSAARMLALRSETAVEDIAVVRLAQRLLPVTQDYRGTRFLVREHGRLLATPLLLALVMVEWADLIFAVDSIPAILAVTTDPFLVFTSNVFAILGLRSLYFLVAHLIERFRYLKVSLVFILLFVGIKMLLQHHVEIPNVVSLAVIASSLFVGVVASAWVSRRSGDTGS
ncbi:TerC/Alx family metal homeostasis membrane protein [Parahaliea mediterranea]|uniref:TerC/Alx family metal homeostasis membrane protein n=1 Tax=Parahaliea mediterranea TaxID=651086 RepID=UPI000E2E91EC|nr:TerC/Alx family metal homeostasis membrane protein [Parahaliea mediterranea]